MLSEYQNAYQIACQSSSNAKLQHEGIPEENYYKSNSRVRPQTAKYNSRQNMSGNKVESHDYTSKINEQAGI